MQQEQMKNWNEVYSYFCWTVTVKLSCYTTTFLWSWLILCTSLFSFCFNFLIQDQFDCCDTDSAGVGESLLAIYSEHLRSYAKGALQLYHILFWYTDMLAWTKSVSVCSSCVSASNMTSNTHRPIIRNRDNGETVACGVHLSLTNTTQHLGAHDLQNIEYCSRF